MGETLSELLDRCRTGDETAVSALVRRFRPWAIALAKGILEDRDLAEDAIQEAFVTALARLDDLREPEAFAGWFRRILRTEANRILRKRREVYLEDEPLSPVGEESVRRRLHRETLQRMVREAVASLSSTQRQTAELFYLEEKTCAEIADFIRIPVGTVKRRLHDARRQLRARLAGILEGEDSMKKRKRK